MRGTAIADRTVDEAVVVGASVGGLAAACALARRADRVTVVERQPVTGGSIAPQGALPHVLLAGGARALERLAPGLTDDLFAHGALGDATGDRPVHWATAGRVVRRFPDLGVRVPMCTRQLVEERLRAHVRALPNVRLLDDTTVHGLVVEQGRVRGVHLTRDGARDVLPADLVVDASGRRAAGVAWLRELGIAPPPTERVEVGVTYTSVVVRRRPEDLDGAWFALVQNTPALARVGVALPAEDDRWQVVLGGYFGDAATPDPDGMRAFAASLPDPAISELLDNAWLGQPITYRFPASRRQRWDRARDLPAGFTVVGDAVASFNPLYGQGMSSAAMQAGALGTCLDRVGNTAALPRAVARAATRVAAGPWQVATGGDFVYPRTTGPRPPAVQLVNRWVARVVASAPDDPAVAEDLVRVQQLLAPTSALFSPRLALRVLSAGRRSQDRVEPAPATASLG